MRAYVLPDARLLKLAGRFVRLEVDTEQPGSAAFVERFPIDAWPTLLVIDPATEAVVVRWAGTAVSLGDPADGNSLDVSRRALRSVVAMAAAISSCTAKMSVSSWS